MTPKQIAVELRRIVDNPFPDEEGELVLFVMEHAEQICTALEATDEAAKAHCSGSDESEGLGAWSRRTSMMVRS
jgi:hypothetical protein